MDRKTLGHPRKLNMLHELEVVYQRFCKRLWEVHRHRAFSFFIVVVVSFSLSLYYYLLLVFQGLLPESLSMTHRLSPALSPPAEESLEEDESSDDELDDESSEPAAAQNLDMIN